MIALSCPRASDEENVPRSLVLHHWNQDDWQYLGLSQTLSVPSCQSCSGSRKQHITSSAQLPRPQDRTKPKMAFWYTPTARCHGAGGHHPLDSLVTGEHLGINSTDSNGCLWTVRHSPHHMWWSSVDAEAFCPLKCPRRKMGPKKQHLARLQGIMLAPDALIDKWLHLPIHYKWVGHHLKIVAFSVKNSGNLVLVTSKISQKHVFNQTWHKLRTIPTGVGSGGKK